jgi:hypothetical protein
MWLTLGWLLFVIPLLWALERQVHQQLQELFALLFGHPDIALMLYTLILLPGVFLHETSHYLMATVLGVRATKFSLWPKRQRNGMLQLGYVEMYKVDPFRESLIGAAPILTGSAVILLVGLYVFNAGALGEALAHGRLSEVFATLDTLTQVRDPWLWLYVIFTVSNAMLPSASDRQAWPVVVVVLLLAAAALYLSGYAAAVSEQVVGPLEYGLRLLATAFSITVAIDAPLLVIVWLLRGLAILITGRRLVK